MKLSKEQVRQYNQQRSKDSKGLICHAPFVNLNFEQNGNVTACCYNRTFVLGTYPENSIQEIWNGEKIKELRDFIKSGDLSGGCSACGEVIESGNFLSSKAKYFDEFAEKKSALSMIKNIFWQENKILPKVLEFEISNSCNLECTMCSGYFSSAIRKNRENLPSFKNHYDEGFVEQISDFLPTLSDAKFLGGEPFLIELYYKIWDKIIEINPKVIIHITTNGTILNKKVKSYLEKLNVGIVISLESLNRARYEQIRINASFDNLMESINFYIDYTKRKGTYLTFAVCPIQKNWMDIPDIMRFCNEHDINIHFNTVWSPETESLMYLTTEKLTEIIDFYNKSTFEKRTIKSSINQTKFDQLIDQLCSWRAQRIQSNESLNDGISILLNIDTEVLENQSKSFQFVFLTIIHQYKNPELTEMKRNIEDRLDNLFDTKTPNPTLVAEEIGIETYIRMYFECMKFIAKLKKQSSYDFNNKIDNILSFTTSLGNDNLKLLLVELNRSGFIFMYEYLQHHTEEELIQMTKNRFLI